jgi:hypothetical protein
MPTLATAPAPPRSRASGIARLAAAAWSLAVLVLHSNAGVAFPAWMLLFGTGLILLAWCAGGTLVAVVSAWRRDEDGAVAASLRAWLPSLAWIAGSVAAVASWLPLMVRLFFGGPALTYSAAWLEQLTAEHLEAARPRVGSFPVREFARYGSELRFLTSECGLVDRCGLVFSPGGRPPNRGEDSFVPLYGFWWHWHQSW